VTKAKESEKMPWIILLILLALFAPAMLVVLVKLFVVLAILMLNPVTWVILGAIWFCSLLA
jgi:hypothetical protein